MSGVRLCDGPDLHVNFSWFAWNLYAAAWPTGVQLLFSFAPDFNKPFGPQGFLVFLFILVVIIHVIYLFFHDD